MTSFPGAGPAAAAGAPAEPLPVAWPRRWGPSARRRPRIVIVGGILMLGASLLMLPGAGDTAMAALAPMAFAVLGAAALALGLREPLGRRSPEFIDSVALTAAKEQPPDSWVHFLRLRRVGIAVLLVFWGIALILVAVVPVAILVALDGRASALLSLVIVVPLGALFLIAAVRSTIAQHRLGSFGRRALGLTFGPSGIALIRIGDPLYIPWDAITAIEPGTLTSRSRREPPVPLIELRLDTALIPDDDAPKTLTLTPAGLHVHPWVTWAALNHYRRSTEARAELGTTFGQRRLEAWSTWAGAHAALS